jgi:hypothetical protein
VRPGPEKSNCRYPKVLIVVSQAFSEEPKSLPPTTTAGAASAKMPERPRVIYAESSHAKIQALRMAWPIAYRRLEELPNISATQLFEELCLRFPGRFTRRQYRTVARRVNRWRQDARARGVVIGAKTYRRLTDKPRGRRPDMFKEHWDEMAKCLEERPDQTALELLVEFQARYPGRYGVRQLHTLQRRVRAWRHEAVRRLVHRMDGLGSDVSVSAMSNTLHEATGNKIT